MALNNKALQAKRAKKATKRKQQIKAKTVHNNIPWSTAVTAPVFETLVWESVFTQGKGYAFFSRKLPNGYIAVAAFLLDMYCLGVKDALYHVTSRVDYETQKDMMQNAGNYHHEDPAYVRKLVEGAVAAATKLGFAAHKDYQIAKLIFGNVDASACAEEFSYLHEGKPFYVCGPHDSPSMQSFIIRQLTAHCGPDGFDYIASA